MTIHWSTIAGLRQQGVPSRILAAVAGLATVRGRAAADGWLEETPDGADFIAFYEPGADDVVLWDPVGDVLSTWAGRAFALGQDNITNAATYAFDCHLSIHETAIDWLRDEARGIVVLDWSRAFDMLRDAPRIMVPERLLPVYRNAMRTKLPEVLVLASERRAAA